jgi:radical SAM protein
MTSATQVGTTSVRRLRLDTSVRPFLVLFELTRACDLACRHCRAESVSNRDPFELTTDEVEAVLDDLAAMGPPRPRVIFTGGDPLRRPDLRALVAHGAKAGLSMGVSPAGTARATAANLAALRLCGATAMSFSIDGASPTTHDGFRGVDGSFAWTVDACRAAATVGLRVQVNTTVTASTVLELPGIARLVDELNLAMWSIFFVVPTGRADSSQALSATETEDVLAFLYDLAPRIPLKTTEAPAFRRLLVQRERAANAHDPGQLYRRLHKELSEVWPSAEQLGSDHFTLGGRRRAPLAVGDGRGVVFVSHTGDVQPSGFLPLVVGNVREAPLPVIYATAPLLRSLRDPTTYHGRCSYCELNSLCGGSRAQAYARSGDPLAEDPTCGYLPAAAAG